MNKYFLLIALSVISLVVSAQNTPPRNYETRFKAFDNFFKLNEGALLVRLKSNQRKIDALKKYGHTDEAMVVKMKQDMENKEIILSFKNEFTFCETYFFYSENSNQVREKDFSKPIFVNENLEIDPSIEFSYEEFLTAEFGSVRQDETPYLDNYILHKDSAGVRYVPTYWSRPRVNFSALVMMTDKFVQLRRPFPRYVRTFASIPFLKRATHKTVTRLNLKLLNYAYD